MTMKVTLKKIDSFLSSNVVGNTIGLYPNLLGLKGRLKLIFSGNQNSQDVIKNGFVELGETLNNDMTNSLKIVLDQLEQKNTNVALNNKITIKSDDLEIYRNSATMKILNGGTLLNYIIPESEQSIKVKIEKYFSANIDICDIMIWRNFPTQDVTLFSGDWHYDRRPSHWFRLFVLLEDVGVHQGPFMFISKADSKQATRKGFKRLDKNWQSRLNSKDQLSKVQKFIGKKGTGVVVDTQNLLHRAGVAAPGHSRDMLQIVFKIT